MRKFYVELSVFCVWFTTTSAIMQPRGGNSNFLQQQLTSSDIVPLAHANVSSTAIRSPALVIQGSAPLNKSFVQDLPLIISEIVKLPHANASSRSSIRVVRTIESSTPSNASFVMHVPSVTESLLPLRRLAMNAVLYAGYNTDSQPLDPLQLIGTIGVLALGIGGAAW